ncbi:MAG: DUF3298 and DUF4163 domain-containing protein [Chloroflexi bacterium]|nr:DUF3298 and DUF4163 domain-containing protein [Chloroflexota bacterium]
MKRTARIITLSLAAALVILLAGALPAAAQGDDEATCRQLMGFWDPVEGRCVLALSFEMELTYPVEVVGYSVPQQAVDEMYGTMITRFTGMFQDPAYLPYGYPMTLYVDYELIPYSAQVYSLRFDISEYTGGAHPNSYTYTMTYDMSRNVMLTLDDVFLPGSGYLDTLAALVQTDLTAQMGEYADAAWIAQGAGPDPWNFRSWTITPAGITFYFDPYQVAPYAMGPQQVTIPLSQLSGWLAPPFGP